VIQRGKRAIDGIAPASRRQADLIDYPDRRTLSFLDHSHALAVKNERLGEVPKSLEQAGQIGLTPRGRRRLW
jgi:hypothetical protein